MARCGEVWCRAISQYKRSTMIRAAATDAQFKHTRVATCPQMCAATNVHGRSVTSVDE